jgi:hypothetical protein
VGAPIAAQFTTAERGQVTFTVASPTSSMKPGPVVMTSSACCSFTAGSSWRAGGFHSAARSSGATGRRGRHEPVVECCRGALRW